MKRLAAQPRNSAWEKGVGVDEKYLQEAADRAMIQELHGRYAFALDYPTNGPDVYADLFTENARRHTGDLDGP